MRSFYPKSTVEQLAEHLRGEIMRGRFADTMPGVGQLVSVLGVGTETVIAAMEILKREGLLVGQGPRRRRKIVRAKGGVGMRAIRVAILPYEPSDNRVHYLVDLRHQLIEAGHDVQIAPKTMKELGMDPRRIARMVGKIEVDAWVVIAGSREVLDWFASRPMPTFALFGRLMKVPLASISPGKAPAFEVVVSRLVAFGHRRIVMLAREERRKPKPGFLEQFFLDQLKGHGIPTGAYNLPDWEDSPEGLQQVLDSLFLHTPPTALVLPETKIFHAARDHLARKGVLAPDHVSLVCSDNGPTFEWSRPAIAHIRWDYRPVVRRVVNWANNLAMGKEDRRKTTTEAEFVEGGTIGPVNEQRET